MTKVRKFKKEYAKELLRIAKGDLDSARGLTQVKIGRPENILFHVEQAVEKSLKAVLCSLGVPVPLIHDIGVVLAKFPDEFTVPESDQMLDLSQFAGIRRYEEGKAPFEPEEINEAIALAVRTIEWAKQLIG